MKAIFKTCEIIRRSSGYYLFGVKRTLYGGITVPPPITLPLTSDGHSLGAAAIGVLGRLSGLMEELNLATARQPYLAYLKANGFRGTAAFEKGASIVMLHFDEQTYDVVPHIPAETGGFVAGAARQCHPACSAVELGSAILEAFNRG